MHSERLPCDVESLTQLARRHGLKLLFDAAHAFGCSHRGRMVGNFGDAEAFSFHATKFFNTLEGGAVATNDDELAQRVRMMRNFGFAGMDQVACLGINAKMNEISAAMGLSNLEELQTFVAVNHRNFRCYTEALSGLPGLRLLPCDESETCNYQYVVAEIDPSITQITRDDVVDLLWAENVFARRYFNPGCHRSEPYRSAPGAKRPLPGTNALCQQVIALPTGTAVGPEEISGICQLLHLALENGPAVVRRLKQPQPSEEVYA